MSILLPIGAGLIFDGHRISDHNRQPIDITITRIETRKRMADGTLRTFLVAQKPQIKANWTNLAWKDERTADGFWGVKSLTQFYNTHPQEFTLVITHGDNTTDTYTVLFASFDAKLNTRSSYTELYDLDITLDVV